MAPGANQVGYWWAAIWEGDRHGLELERFKAVCAELDLGLDFGFNGTPAYNQEAFRRGAIHHRRERTVAGRRRRTPGAGPAGGSGSARWPRS